MREFKVFDQLPMETSRQYLGFCCFRDQGQKRNLQQAYQRYRLELGKITQEEYDRRKGANPSRHFIKWRKEFLWDDRAWAYDLKMGRYHPAIRQLDFFKDRSDRLLQKLAASEAKMQKNLEKLASMAGVSLDDL
jgi:hypothetical protein